MPLTRSLSGCRQFLDVSRRAGRSGRRARLQAFGGREAYGTEEASAAAMDEL